MQNGFAKVPLINELTSVGALNPTPFKPQLETIRRSKFCLTKKLTSRNYMLTCEGTESILYTKLADLRHGRNRNTRRNGYSEKQYGE